MISKKNWKLLKNDSSLLERPLLTLHFNDFKSLLELQKQNLTMIFYYGTNIATIVIQKL